MKRELDDLQTKYVHAMKREKDTLTLFGIDTPSPFEQSMLENADRSFKSNTKSMRSRNKSRSASFKSNDRQPYLSVLKLGDVIEEELSHDEPEAQRNQGKLALMR